MKNKLTVTMMSNAQILELLAGKKLAGKSLDDVLTMDEDELAYYKLTDKQINTILAIKELCRRTTHNDLCVCEDVVNKPSKVYDYLKMEIGYDNQEAFCVLFLNNAGKVIKTEVMYKGSKSSSIVAVDEIYRKAIILKASNIIVAHCHPSGSLTPSSADMELTKRVKDAGEMLGIKLLDHIIVNSSSGYFSFKSQGLLN